MVLTPLQIKAARVGLHLSQGHLANLLAVHPMTVYKWEAGISAPERTQEQLLVGLHQLYEREQSKRTRQELGRGIATALVTGGALLGLAILFSALFPSKTSSAKP